MIDDINSYTFDFEKEAGDLHRRLGTKGDNILFIEAEITQSGNDSEPSQVRTRRIVGSEELKRVNSAGASKFVTSHYHESPKDSSRAFTLRESAEGAILGHIVSIRKNEPYTKTFGKEKESLMRLWVLYHETGHALVPDGPEDDVHPFRECAADAYAALCFFQRFGQEAGDLLSMISWGRSFETVISDPGHLTTPVLDKIIADSAAYQNFLKLSPAETMTRAETYAKDWTPEASTLIAARPFFTQAGHINLSQLAETCLTSANDFAFYIGSKLFQPFLHPDGVVLDGQIIKIPDDQRQKFTAAIETRAAGMDLCDIFGPAAERSKKEPPLAEALKVSRPKGQKPFTVNI